jgi:Spy/CpxP family protein refolding chaperone
MSDVRRQWVTWLTLPPEGRRAKIAELRDRVRSQVNEALTPAQAERLRQIRVQVDEALALTDKDIGDSLGLSEEQRSRMRGVLGRAGARLRELVRGPSAGEREIPPELREKAEELHREAIQEALGLLTPRQRENLERMKAKRFEWGPVDGSR